MSDAYGDIASTILIFVIFIVAFIWAKRTRKTGRAQGTYVHDEWLEDSLREEDDWRHLQDLHRRFNE